MIERILDLIASKLYKPITYKPVSEISINTALGSKWVADEDGIMVIKITPKGNTTAHCDIDCVHDNIGYGVEGSKISYNLITREKKSLSAFPMVKGVTYIISDIANVERLNLTLYPFEKIGGV